MRDPVPDIREIITDRKEAGGLPSSTFLNLAPEKQEKLLSAAVREFTERPYNEASINRIVREAGIPRGSFYMYFRDKEDLFHYLMEESINEMLMVFEEVLHSQGGDIFAALPAMYDHLRSRRSADRSLGGMGMMSAIVNRNDGLQKGRPAGVSGPGSHFEANGGLREPRSAGPAGAGGPELHSEDAHCIDSPHHV